MTTFRLYIEKVLFPGWSHAQRRRHMRFLVLAIFLGGLMAAGFGAILFQLSSQGRL